MFMVGARTEKFCFVSVLYAHAYVPEPVVW